ncbi:hypothetical protein ACOCJ5_16350 [Knoellia sp. CPCC 206450]|uniref:hypothetical protein n=1 Tax=Knoellia tibetensis TaxID=3404798 RepID=UPI003B42DC95
MASARAATSRQAEHDAVLGCAVAVTCGLAFLIFVAVPVRVGALEVPVALEWLWHVGFLVGAFLGPVGAGLAAYASGVALWTGGPDLTRRARWLHRSTVTMSVVLLVAYVANASALRLWLD